MRSFRIARAFSTEKRYSLSKNKANQFSAWYQEVLTRCELIDYSDVPGCYILRPWAYSIWEQIQSFLDTNLKKKGVRNAYFPLFIPQKALFAETQHLEGFAPEVAWVTRMGKSDLHEPLAIRPTSETIIYPAFSKWINSHRDLPLRINQWCSVVRWESKSPTPFIRSREFLWQEGHSAFAKKEDAEFEVKDILSLYKTVYTDLLAIPVIDGKKTELEKFAGAYYTTTLETFIPTVGRGIQAATSHCLGQTFAKIFHLQYIDENKIKQYVWQNSWGFTTRSIGILVMLHGDDKGLVLPPPIAPIQIIIIPIGKPGKDLIIKEKAEHLKRRLQECGLRVEIDDANKPPGSKFYYWEMKGVPLRIEIGEKDLQKNQIVTVRRDNGSKTFISLEDNNNISTQISLLLSSIHQTLLENATKKLTNSIHYCYDYNSFLKTVQNKLLALSPWCGENTCEIDIKKRSSIPLTEKDLDENDSSKHHIELTGTAKSLCIPEKQEHFEPHLKCIGCEKNAKMMTLFGHSY